MDAQMDYRQSLNDEIERMIAIGEEKVKAELKKDYEKKEELRGNYNLLFFEIKENLKDRIPSFILDQLQYTEEDMKDLYLKRHSNLVSFKLGGLAPVYLCIDVTEVKVLVEYIVPALYEDGTLQDLRHEKTGKKVFKEELLIQTPDLHLALFYARQRFNFHQDMYFISPKAMDEQGYHKPILVNQSSEPIYEDIERTQMVNPSLDDLLNLQIEQALKKAMA